MTARLLDDNLEPRERSYLDRHGFDLDSPLTEKEVVATGLVPGVRSPTTVRISRSTGMICGVPAPEYEKIGSRVFYTPAYYDGT